MRLLKKKKRQPEEKEDIPNLQPKLHCWFLENKFRLGFQMHASMTGQKSKYRWNGPLVRPQVGDKKILVVAFESQWLTQYLLFEVNRSIPTQPPPSPSANFCCRRLSDKYKSSLPKRTIRLCRDQETTFPPNNHHCNHSTEQSRVSSQEVNSQD